MSFVENPVPRVRVESSCEESSKRISCGEFVWRVCVESLCGEFVWRVRVESSCGESGGSFVENPVGRVRERVPLENPVQSSCAEVPCQEFVERSRSELRGEASSSSSEFVELSDLHFVSRPGATHRPLLGVGSSGNDASTEGSAPRITSTC